MTPVRDRREARAGEFEAGGNVAVWLPEVFTRQVGAGLNIAVRGTSEAEVPGPQAREWGDGTEDVCGSPKSEGSLNATGIHAVVVKGRHT